MLAVIDHNMHMSRKIQVDVAGELQPHKKYSNRTQKFHSEIEQEEKKYSYFRFVMATMQCLSGVVF